MCSTWTHIATVISLIDLMNQKSKDDEMLTSSSEDSKSIQCVELICIGLAFLT